MGPNDRKTAAAIAPSSTPLNRQGRAFAKFTVEDLEVFQIFEGSVSRELDASFFSNLPVAAIDEVLATAGFPPGRIPNSYTITIARVAGSLVMFDAGLGEHGWPKSGQLGTNMKAAGLDPSELSAIVVTHFHPDHIFGLMTAKDEQVYPDLPIYVPAAEFDFWTRSDAIPRHRQALADRIRRTLPHWPNVVPYRGDAEILPGLWAIPSHGHSAGHTSVLVGSGASQVCVMGDVTNVPAFNMRHPEWRLAADDDPEQAATTRKAMLNWATDAGVICTGYHWGMPGIGRIIRTADGFGLEALEMT